MTLEDRKFIGKEHFNLRPRDAHKLMLEAFEVMVEDTNRTEPGPGGCLLVWVDPEGVVKVPVFTPSGEQRARSGSRR